MEFDDLCSLASDTGAPQIERIAALKDLYLCVGCDNNLAVSAANVAAAIVLNRKDDYLVRQHAANELALYPCPVSAEQLSAILVDPCEDLDLRINLLDAFGSWQHPLSHSFKVILKDNDPLLPYV